MEGGRCQLRRVSAGEASADQTRGLRISQCRAAATGGPLAERVALTLSGERADFGEVMVVIGGVERKAFCIEALEKALRWGRHDARGFQPTSG